MHLIKKNFFN